MKSAKGQLNCLVLKGAFACSAEKFPYCILCVVPTLSREKKSIVKFQLGLLQTKKILDRSMSESSFFTLLDNCKHTLVGSTRCVVTS